MNIHRSDLYVQRGSGIGNIFTNIFRGLVPLASKLFHVGKKVVASPTGQKILTAAKRTAMDAGIDIASDVLRGENVKASTKKSLKKVGKHFLENAKKEFNKGGGIGKRRRRGKGKKKLTSKKCVTNRRIVKRVKKKSVQIKIKKKKRLVKKISDKRKCKGKSKKKKKKVGGGKKQCQSLLNLWM